MAMAVVPRNSLMGWARFWRRVMRLERRKYTSFSALKRPRTLSSALKALMMRRPPRHSSMFDIRPPQRFCCSSDLRFRALPTRPITRPAIGRSTITKSVSCHDIAIIVPRHTSIITGFLKIMSSDDIMEFSISATSPLMRAIMSPLRSEVKKPMGSDTILLNMVLRMSRTMPLRIGTTTYIAR